VKKKNDEMVTQNDFSSKLSEKWMTTREMSSFNI